jgi:arsenate reductase
VDRKPALVFLCVHNAGRSQMAAAWARHLGAGRVEVSSGGSGPAAAVNPAVVAVMAEAQIDLAGQVPRKWTEAAIRSADVVVTMGCGDTCPYFPGVRYEDWDVAEPAGRDPAAIRAVRDEIRRRVADLLTRLGIEPTPA